MRISSEYELSKTRASVEPILRVHPEVRAALVRGGPVVALESTILAHGLPRPHNKRAAHQLQDVVRANGAVPAIVAVLSGVPLIGLNDEQIAHICRSQNVRKLSIRDLPTAMARKEDGATTVAATMFLSSAAGVKVFATGGIGGVHRGIPHPLDISADIPALASIQQLVVSAGIKSILDVANTLELLETASIPTIVLGSKTFPAFLHRVSPHRAPVTVHSERDAARIFSNSAALGLRNGMLLAVPIPERFNTDTSIIESAERRALEELQQQQLTSSQVTPFLLKRVAELTKGVSVRANIALAENNAAVAARVAAHLSQLQKRVFASSSNVRPHVLIIGGTALDVHCDPSSVLLPRTSNVGVIRVCAGGVGRNIAQAASTLGNARVTFVSCVGDDVAGQTILRFMQHAGMDIRHVRQYPGKRSGVVCIVHDHQGDLSVAVADLNDMFGNEEHNGVPLASDAHEDIGSALRTARVALIDGNLSPSQLSQIASQCVEAGVPVWYEPTSLHKCVRIVHASALRAVKYTSPNEAELREMARALSCVGSLEDCALALLKSCARDASVICTRGEQGVRRYSYEEGRLQIADFDAKDLKGGMVNTTGAGDCFAGVCIAALAAGDCEADAIRKGIEAATMSCESEHAVPKVAAKL